MSQTSEIKLLKRFDQNVEITGNLTIGGSVSGISTDNFYLDGITKSGNTLTFSVNGTTNQTYTFGSAAFANTTAFLQPDTDIDTGRITIANNVSSGGFGSFDDYQIILYKDTTASTSYGLGIEGSTFMFHTNGAYKFYANNAVKATISNSGNLTLTGAISASGYNKSNWDTAYGWGNHASAGYLTSVPSHTHDDRYYTESESDSRFTSKDHFRSTGTGYYTSTTTSNLLAEALSDGAFNSYLTAHKTGWSYAGNGNLTDAGRLTELAGTSWLWWTDNSADATYGNITGLCIAPNTGGSANKVFIYNNQGSSYAPGWREVWTSASDGSGSGLDADLLDGQHASSFAPAGGSAGTDWYCDDLFYDQWIRNNGTGNSGLYWHNSSHDGYAWHIYPESRADMTFRTGLGNGGIKGTIENSTARGYIHWTTSNEIGFLNASRSWSLRVDNSGNTFATGSHRAPIFYDSDNTGYYVDPAGTATLNQCNANGFLVDGTYDGLFGFTGMSWGGSTSYPTLYSGHSDRWIMHIKPHIVWTQNGQRGYTGSTQGSLVRFEGNLASDRTWDLGCLTSIASGGDYFGAVRNVGGATWAFYADPSTNFFANASVRSPIFYDRDNTGYYINPAGLSYVNEIRSNEAQANPRWDTAFYVLQAQHWYGDNSSQTMYIGESGNTVNVRGTMNFSGGHGAINITNSSILSSATSAWTGNPGGAGKIQYHSNRWYIVSDSSSNRIVQFRRDGSDKCYINNDGRLIGPGGDATGDWRAPIFYDSNNTAYYLDPTNISVMNEIRFQGSGARAIEGTSVNGYNTIRMSGNWNTFDVMGRVLDWTGSNLHVGDGYNGQSHSSNYINFCANGNLSYMRVGGSGYFEGDVIAYYSDARLKQNVEPINNALDIIKSIRGVTFEWNKVSESVWKKKEGDKDFGLIAQEVEAVFPMGVAVQCGADIAIEMGYGDPKSENYDPLHNPTNEEEQYKTVRYDKMVSVAIQAIKEQQETIESLQKQIDELKSLINKS